MFHVVFCIQLRALFIIRRLEPANLYVMLLLFFFVKSLWTMGCFLPIWNKIQNLEALSESFRPWVASVGSFRPESFRPFFVVSALIGGSFRSDFLGGSFRQVYAGGRSV